MVRDREYLFSNVGWHDVERRQLQELQKAVESMDGNRFLVVSAQRTIVLCLHVLLTQ